MTGYGTYLPSQEARRVRRGDTIVVLPPYSQGDVWRGGAMHKAPAPLQLNVRPVQVAEPAALTHEEVLEVSYRIRGVFTRTTDPWESAEVDFRRELNETCLVFAERAGVAKLTAEVIRCLADQVRIVQDRWPADRWAS